MINRFIGFFIICILTLNTALIANAAELEVTGKFVLNKRGEMVLEANNGKHFMLFDKKNKDNDMVYYKYFMYLEKDIADKVISAKKAGQTVTAKGSALERVGMPDGILLGELIVHNK